MAAKRFSGEELYSLRNDIPVERVIKDALGIPWREVEGCFRFLCPECNKFNTAVNPATNLGRCFYCERNFNAIDLVMLINQADFVNSVRFLKKYRQGQAKQILPIKHDLKVRTDGPSHIGNVLETVIGSCKPVAAPADENLCNRVLALEQKLDRLARRIEELAKSSS